MTNKDLFQKVREMKLPLGEYALFGSAPLGIRELKICHDIDIIVTPDLYNKYKKDGWEVETTPDGSEYLGKDEIEIWQDWWPPASWDLKKLIQEAEIINDLPFVKLEDVVKWKKMSGRKKDLGDLEIVEKFLHNHTI